MLASCCVDHVGSALLNGCSPILTHGHLHNPEPCPPWAHVYLFSVEPAEVRVERTLTLPCHTIGPPASVRELLAIHKQEVLSCRPRQAGRFSFLPLWGFPVCCLDVAVFLVWLPLALSCHSHSCHASTLSLLLWRLVGSLWCGCFARMSRAHIT